jgi:hypothetical protein
MVDSSIFIDSNLANRRAPDSDQEDEEAALGARSQADSMEQQLLRHPRYRYSGVFIDIIVALVFFGVIASVGFAIMPNWNLYYAAFVAAASVFLVCFLMAIGLPLLTRRKVSIRRANSWGPRHFFGRVKVKGSNYGFQDFCLLLCH